MGQFSGRQTDSHGMSRNDAGRVDANSHVQGTKKVGHNKGVMAIRREIKREEAEARNLLTRPERRSGYVAVAA